MVGQPGCVKFGRGPCGTPVGPISPRPRFRQANIGLCAVPYNCSGFSTIAPTMGITSVSVHLDVRLLTCTLPYSRRRGSSLTSVGRHAPGTFTGECFFTRCAKVRATDARVSAFCGVKCARSIGTEGRFAFFPVFGVPARFLGLASPHRYSWLAQCRTRRRQHGPPAFRRRLSVSQ